MNKSASEVPRHGAVVPGMTDRLPWAIQFPDETVTAWVNGFLVELSANDCSPLTLRSYAHDLLRWSRFCRANDRSVRRAVRSDVRDFVLWLRDSDNPQRLRRVETPAAGSTNARTGKPYLGTGYAPATINHALSVLARFYDYLAELGEGPVINPVPRGQEDRRRYAHHDPLEPYGAQWRAPYRQRVPDRAPRALSQDVVKGLFAEMRCHRDRALLSLYLSSGTRAGELLGMTGGDVDWGRQLIGVVSKGTRAKDWIPASAEAFDWLALYLAEGAPRPANGALWWTRRQPQRPLAYTALRAVLRRANESLGTNVTVHDFRHTCAHDLVRDPALSLTDVKTVLRHRRLSSTGRYLSP